MKQVDAFGGVMKQYFLSTPKYFSPIESFVENFALLNFLSLNDLESSHSRGLTLIMQITAIVKIDSVVSPSGASV